MPAAYDTYDYPSYWKERVYEHKSEVIAIKKLLSRIKQIKTLIDLGAGFGRLTPIYLHRAKKIILVDPSSRLLKIARKGKDSRKLTYIHSSIENLASKMRRNSADVVLLVRVVHHIKHIDAALSVVNKICKKNGYLILEYPNKRHLKSTITEIFQGNFTYAIDIFPKDRSSPKSIKKNALPFINYHPDFIAAKLTEYNFKIVESISVSYLRSGFFKRFMPLDLLLAIEAFLQKYISILNLAPSVFVLAKKID